MGSTSWKEQERKLALEAPVRVLEICNVLCGELGRGPYPGSLLSNRDTIDQITSSGGRSVYDGFDHCCSREGKEALVSSLANFILKDSKYTFHWHGNKNFKKCAREHFYLNVLNFFLYGNNLAEIHHFCQSQRKSFQNLGGHLCCVDHGVSLRFTHEGDRITGCFQCFGFIVKMPCYVAKSSQGLVNWPTHPATTTQSRQLHSSVGEPHTNWLPHLPKVTIIAACSTIYILI